MEHTKISNVEKIGEGTTLPYTEKLFMENEDNFDVLVITSGSIKHLDYSKENYLDKLLDESYFNIKTTNNNDFIKFMTETLETDKYIKPNLNVKTEIICEDKEYMYEIMYVEILLEDDKINESATLINTNGEKIYSNAIVFKSKLEHNSNSMKFESITKQDVKNFMNMRISTKLVLYEDDTFREEYVLGDLNTFCQQFFEGEGIIKVENKFLNYDISIWYCTDYGKNGVLGRLVKYPVYKAIIFTLISDDLRGNISLDEVKKIIRLSQQLDLETFETPDEFKQEKKDALGRVIINNKYRVLSKIYSKYN